MKSLKIVPRVTPRDCRSVEIYLHDIAQMSLLSIEEEVSLAQRIHAGDEQALERMVKGNLRFVVSVAKFYLNRGIEFSDLISIGNIGLITAARRFDETRGVRFCCYAVWWIRQTILQAFAKEGRTIKLPANQMDFLNKINRVAALLEQELQRTPTSAEVAQQLEEDEHKICQLLRISQEAVSLDMPCMDDSDVARVDMLADTSTPMPDEGLMRESLHHDIEAALANLPRPERAILKMSYGIDYPHPYTATEIAMHIGLSSERVRQLHNRALARLQQGEARERLAAYI